MSTVAPPAHASPLEWTPSKWLWQFLVSAILFAFGDFIAQRLETVSSSSRGVSRAIATVCSYPASYDFARSGRILFFGVVILTPIQAFWQDWLAVTFPEATFVSAFTKMALDQLIMAPVVLSFMFFIISMMEHMHCRRAVTKARLSIGPTLMTNYKVWPFIQFFNMLVVPPDLRLTFVLLAQIPWSAYLALQIGSSSSPRSEPQRMDYLAVVTDDNELSDDETPRGENQLQRVQDATRALGGDDPFDL